MVSINIYFLRFWTFCYTKHHVLRGFIGFPPIFCPKAKLSTLNKKTQLSALVDRKSDATTIILGKNKVTASNTIRVQ